MENKNIKAGDFHSVSNSISGNNVTANQGGNYNQIHQNIASNSKTPEDTAAIEDILKKLRIAVVESEKLSSSEKLETLKQIDVLEKATQNPETPESENLIKNAISTILNTAGQLPVLLELLKTFQSLLPTLGNFMI